MKTADPTPTDGPPSARGQHPQAGLAKRGTLHARLLALAGDDLTAFCRARIVLGADTVDPEYALPFYGCDVVRRAGRGEIVVPDDAVVTYPVDWSTDDDVALIAACVKHKGASCYGEGYRRVGVN